MLNKLLIKEVVDPVFVVIISFLSYRLIKLIVDKISKSSKRLKKNKKSLTVARLITNIIKYIIMIIAVILILSVWGVNTSALVASFSVITAVIGLAFQDILKDFFAGFSIIFDDEYNVGDNVKISDFRGTVEEISLRNTKIRAYTGEVMILSNRNIDQVINYSTSYNKCLYDISVAYESDLKLVEKVLLEVCDDLTRTVDFLKGDVILDGIDSLDESSIVYRLEANCAAVQDTNFKRIANKKIVDAFNKNGISIPYNQVVVHNAKL